MRECYTWENLYNLELQKLFFLLSFLLFWTVVYLTELYNFSSCDTSKSDWIFKFQLGVVRLIVRCPVRFGQVLLWIIKAFEECTGIINMKVY